MTPSNRWLRGVEGFGHHAWVTSLTSILTWLVAMGSLAATITVRGAVPRTCVSIAAGRWHINGEVTYRGSRAEGLLLNVRMVNATFEDVNRPEFDAEANSHEFIAQIPDYVAHGVRAFTLNLQGGMPGYEGAVNSAFNSDGSLRSSYLGRVRRVIEACDRHGAVVMLGCYYQRQDQALRDENAVRTGVVNVVRWIGAAGFSNVVLEIANEFGHGGFDHRLLRSAEGQAELIRLARQTAPELLISSSGLGGGAAHESVARASDFLLVHFNATRLEDMPERIASLKRHGKPIVCNEDQKSGDDGAKAAELCVANGASWGLMLEKLNQHFPFSFRGAADDPVVYAPLKRLASHQRAGLQRAKPEEVLARLRQVLAGTARSDGLLASGLDAVCRWLSGWVGHAASRYPTTARQNPLAYAEKFGTGVPGRRAGAPTLCKGGLGLGDFLPSTDRPQGPVKSRVVRRGS